MYLNMKYSWQQILNEYPKDINSILNNISLNNSLNNSNKNIFPSRENMFKCFNFCEISEIKVVIIGQDPYHGPNQATGLSFAVNNNIKTPPSLRNIIKELNEDINVELSDNTLELWAKQGVLLMNSAFTVLENTPGSHIKQWSDFTDYIISKLNSHDNLIFVAWGAFAFNKFKMVDETRHFKLVSSHPSPLSYSKPFKNYPSFKGSKPFSKINNKLLEFNKSIIIW